MTECYRFEERIYNDSIFKNVDATYIIHLEDNGRLPHIESQLSEYHPTEKVYILFNKGYKKCKKKDYIDKSPRDLVDAYYTIFNDSRDKKYNNILILEDDFIFDEKIKDKKHSESIDEFINNNKNNKFIYYLGTLVLIQIYFFQKHNRVVSAGGTHSIIYSKKFTDYLLDNVKQVTVEDWDVYLNFNFINRFKYNTPLCYQTFPETENSKYWCCPLINSFFYQITLRKIINILKLNTEPQFGFNFIEILSRILFWLIIFIFVVIFNCIKNIKFKNILSLKPEK
jgi:GR25 family glycosyltransferase involved in LPS biosynthesis